MDRHHHNRPPPPPFHPINHTTTTQIFLHSLKIITTHISTFLLLSLLLFSFHFNVRHAADYLSSFLEDNPPLKSLITRIEISHQNNQLRHLHRHRRRRPFLHLTRVGTLDDDFFSSDSDFDRSLFNPVSKPDPNSTFLIFSNLGFDFPKAILNKGFSFKSPLENYHFTPHHGDLDNRVSKNYEFTPHPGDLEGSKSNHGGSGSKDYEFSPHPGDLDDIRTNHGSSGSKKYEFSPHPADLDDNSRSSNGSSDGDVENDEFMPRVGDLDKSRFGNGGSDGDVENYEYSRHPGDIDDSRSGNGGSDSDVENYGYSRYPGDVDNSNKNGGGSDEDMVDLRFLIGLRLNRRDAVSFFYLIGFLTAFYGYMIVSFVMIYTWIYGIVFLQVVEDVLGRYRSIFRTLWVGSGIGIKRLAGFVLMRWAVRDALSQVVGIYFFGEVEDQFTIFRVLVRMKLMPFSDVSMLIKGHERESVGFILTWFFVELVVGFIFAVDSYVAIVDSRKSGKEIMKEGCRMLATMLFPSMEIKCWEAMACGVFTRWILKAAGGEVFALVFQSFMEIYFMVVWLVFYLAAKEKEALLTGRTFGQQEVEGFLEGIR